MSCCHNIALLQFAQHIVQSEIINAGSAYILIISYTQQQDMALIPGCQEDFSCKPRNQEGLDLPPYLGKRIYSEKIRLVLYCFRFARGVLCKLTAPLHYQAGHLGIACHCKDSECFIHPGCECIFKPRMLSLKPGACSLEHFFRFSDPYLNTARPLHMGKLRSCPGKLRIIIEKCQFLPCQPCREQTLS